LEFYLLPGRLEKHWQFMAGLFFPHKERKLFQVIFIDFFSVKQDDGFCQIRNVV
jgi:hypothetical protein